MESIIRINNCAVDLMNSGCHLDALHLFKDALHSLQVEMSTDHKNSSCSEDTDILMSSPSAYVSALSRDQDGHRLPLEQRLSAGGDYVYRNGIQADPESLTMETKGGLLMLSVILVFNMALAHHIDVIDSPQGKSHLALEGALKLYELGFQMQVNTGVRMDMTYTMALLNNCGHAYKALNDQRKAMKYYNHMLSSLFILVENGEARTIDDLDGFLWSASRLILQNEGAAAAAA